MALKSMVEETVAQRPKEAVLWILQLEDENRKLKRQRTLRDEFATAVLQGAIGAYGMSAEDKYALGAAGWNSNIAKFAYDMADAMLEAREK